MSIRNKMNRKNEQKKKSNLVIRECTRKIEGAFETSRLNRPGTHRTKGISYQPLTPLAYQAVHPR